MADALTPYGEAVPGEIPPELKAILDKAAGKDHSEHGPVVRCLAEILTVHERMVAGQARAEERRNVAEEIRLLGDWPDGYGAFRAFMARHGLDRHGETPVFSGLLVALADEVASKTDVAEHANKLASSHAGEHDAGEFGEVSL